MNFVSFSDLPISREVTFETKTRATGVGFVTIGQRIRGLLCNNKLDLSGVNVSDDYDDEATDNKWVDDDKLAYGETFSLVSFDVTFCVDIASLDSFDVAFCLDTASSMLFSNLEEMVSILSATSSLSMKSCVSSYANLSSSTHPAKLCCAMP